MARLPVAVVIVTMTLSSCARSETPAASAAPSAEAARLEAEIGTRFRRPALQSYLLLPDSFIGGSFPASIAALLREVEEFEGEYVTLLQGATTTPQPVIEAHQAFVQFARVTAELYELMAPASASLRFTRDGLEISDALVLEEYNWRVDEVNAARDSFEAALQALTTEQQAPFSRMGLTVHLKK